MALRCHMRRLGFNRNADCRPVAAQRSASRENRENEFQQPINREETAMWTKPEYTEMRFGFEVTMYIANR
jgi:coenzyme PQQ precursor peptide PqqA